MVAALLAADQEGGDSRGRQATALLIVGEGKGYGGLNDRWIDLRVDDHAEPIPELQRLLELHRLYFDRAVTNALKSLKHRRYYLAAGGTSAVKGVAGLKH